MCSVSDHMCTTVFVVFMAVMVVVLITVAVAGGFLHVSDGVGGNNL